MHHILFPGSSGGDGGYDGRHNGDDGVVRRAGAGVNYCSDLLAAGHTRSGVYSFTPSSLHRTSYGHDYYNRRVRAWPQHDGQWS